MKWQSIQLDQRQIVDQAIDEQEGHEASISWNGSA
jgi:hypothetical protein